MTTRKPTVAFFGDPSFEVNRLGVRMLELRCRAHDQVAPHEHPLPQLSLVIEGSGVEVMQGRARRESPGTLTYRPSHTEHSGKWEAAGGTVFTIEVGSAKRDRWAELGIPLHVPQTLRGHAVELAYHIRREVLAPDRWSEFVLDGLLMELAIELARHDRFNETPRWLHDVRDVICRSDGPLSLTELSALVSKHPTHVARAFRKHFGITPGECRRQHVIARAKQALTVGKPIGEISAELGFADQSHFSTTFRRITGQTPSAYRHAATRR